MEVATRGPLSTGASYLAGRDGYRESVGTADRIAHCAMMLDQCRALCDEGRHEDALRRAHDARQAAMEARTLAGLADHEDQIAELMSATLAMLERLERGPRGA